MLSPPGVVLRRWDESMGTTLFPTEESAVRPALSARKLEFAKGRAACARAAISALGMPSEPLPVAPEQDPEWPPGVVGTISHTAGLILAVAARASLISVIGIDVQARRPLPPEIVDVVLCPEEQGAVEDPIGLMGLFSAKEAVQGQSSPPVGSASASDLVSDLVRRSVLLADHVFTVCYREAESR